MKLSALMYLVLAAALLMNVGVAQEMSKDEWQQEMTKYKQLRDNADAKVKDLVDKMKALQSQSSKLDADYEQCLGELYGLVGSDATKAAAYRAQLEAAENKANELMRLSDADLMTRSGEVTELDNTVKGMWENKLSLIPEFYDRLTVLNEKLQSLKGTIAGKGAKTYTVGTWRKDRDCLWNISKKKDIYNDPWKWPKIWQGNRDQIKNPDVIHTGQKLKIPDAGELSKEEKAAARGYYAKKAAGGK